MKNPAKMNHIEVLNHIGQLNRQSDLKSQEIKLLKQRIERLEWELEGIQCVFANENDDPLIDPFNSENLFKWLNRNDIEQQEKGVNHIGAMLTSMGWCGVESLCKRAIEQLRNGVSDE